MENGEYQDSGVLDINLKIRDLEEKQRIQKDRLKLLETNLIELKNKLNNETLSIKQSIEIIKQNINKLTSFLETASIEFQKFARKEDIELLAKQIKMLGGA